MNDQQFFTNPSAMRLTEAQITICLQQFRVRWCPICRQPKPASLALCKTCYFSLPENMRVALYTGRDSRQSLEEWCENYLAAKKFLREQRGLVA